MRFLAVCLSISLGVTLSVAGQGTSFYAPFDSPPYAFSHVDHMNELIKSLHDDTELPEKSPLMDESPWKRWATVDNYSFGKDRGGMPMIADLNALHPYFRDKIFELIRICKSKGIELAVVESFRTHAKQNEYKSMGKKYTRSSGGGSKHQYGLAVDVVPIIDSLADWHNYTVWKKVGAIGEKLGLRWGGRWKHMYDPGHFEWTAGLSSYHLATGKFPKIPKPQLYPCLEEDLSQLTSFWQSWETEQSTIASQKVELGKMK